MKLQRTDEGPKEQPAGKRQKLTGGRSITEEQPTDEQPTDEQPTEEQPTEEQPTEEQPTEEQPTEEQPTEEQPKTEQPKTEQPNTEQDVRWAMMSEMLHSIGQLLLCTSEKMNKVVPVAQETTQADIQSNPDVPTELENSPDLFNNILLELGIHDFVFQDICCPEGLPQCFGIVALIPSHVDPTEHGLCLENSTIHLARQTVPSSCGFVSIINILANLNDASVPSFSQETVDSTHYSDMTARVLKSSTVSVQTCLDYPKYPQQRHHFISYIKDRHDIIILDGLRDKPVIIGFCSDKTFVATVRDHILKIVDTEEFPFPSIMGLFKK